MLHMTYTYTHTCTYTYTAWALLLSRIYVIVLGDKIMKFVGMLQCGDELAGLFQRVDTMCKINFIMIFFLLLGNIAWNWFTMKSRIDN